VATKDPESRSAGSGFSLVANKDGQRRDILPAKGTAAYLPRGLFESLDHVLGVGSVLENSRKSLHITVAFLSCFQRVTAEAELL
jgi:hypothetical protein